MTQAVDLIIRPGWIVPVRPRGTVLVDHEVVIDRGRIVAVAELDGEARYEAREVRELPGHVLLPGLINAHGHAPMALLRGIGDDMALMPWLKDRIWPAEAAFADAEFVADGMELAIAEMVRGGTTTSNEMYFFPDAMARAALAAGFRVCVGVIVVEFPSRWAQTPDEYLSRGLKFHDEMRGEPLISTTLAPHAPYTVSDASFKRIALMADQLDLPVTIHLHESAGEIEESKRAHGLRPFARLRSLGLVNEHLLAVHMTQLKEEEIATCARAGVKVLHCPESNLKLASGFCPVERLRRAGVTVALGTDGAASNNDLDMFGEMRTAALLGKGVAADPEAVPAASVLEMATISGAVALGLDDQLGSVEAGKQADLIAVSMDSVETQPLYDVISQLIYATGRAQVTDVWIQGRELLRERRLTTIDLAELRARTEVWRARIGRKLFTDG